MPVSKTFIANRSFKNEYPRSDEPDEMLEQLAAATTAVARGAAPRRTGAYAESIFGVVGARGDGVHVGRVLATDFKAHWIEAGTGPPLPTAAHHTLEKAVEQVVGKVGK